MKKMFKLFTASLLTVALSIATVTCCCSASAAAAHFHKVVNCSHCPSKGAQGNSNPVRICPYQLTSAEFSHSPAFIPSAASNFSFPAHSLFNKHITTFLPSILAYPRGSPPLAANFIPLYLRTFSLSI